MSKARVMVVDDEEYLLEACADALSSLDGIEIDVKQDSTQALEILSRETYDLLITDIRMPGVDGLELLRAARESNADLAVLMMTAFPTVETAVESMKLGAADYLTKPFLPEDLCATAKRLLDEKRLREENQLLRRQLERSYKFDEIIGKSSAMQEVFDTIQSVADTDVDVLIHGETGSGKELVARSVHQRSSRKESPFVPVDCGAIPENLLESEFFGHEKGAFTGAEARSLGLLEFADGGTFFLDEIAELPQQLQAKLLRALQERKFRRVGGKEEIEVDIRIVAATHRDLEQEVREGRFRQDLYYRVNVVKIDIPALRDRPEDIPLLIDHFVGQFSESLSKGQTEISPEAVEILQRYPWPGNIRELQNVLKRAFIMARGAPVDLAHLPDEVVARIGEPTTGPKGGFFHLRELRMNVFEKEYLGSLLAQCEGDATRAAREAQMPRGTLYRLLGKHDLKPESYRK